MGFSAATLSVVLLITALSVADALRLSRSLRKLQRSVRRLAQRRAEQTFAVERRMQIAQTQVLTESAVHGTTAAVRTIHKNIANIPFGIFESIPVTRSTARFVRTIHDRTADGVYDTIANVNRLVGGVARAGLSSRGRSMIVPQVAVAPEPKSIAALPASGTPMRELREDRAKK